MRSRGSHTFVGADWRRPAAGWQQWGERSQAALRKDRPSYHGVAGAGVGGQPGFDQLLCRPLELPDYVAARIELAKFIAAEVDSLPQRLSVRTRGTGCVWCEPVIP